MKDLWFEIRYHLWDVPKDWYYSIKWFFVNCWRFRKVVWNFRPWDWHYCVDTFVVTIEQLRDCIKDGHEEDRSRLKKVDALNKLIEQLKLLNSDDDFGLEDAFLNNTITIDEFSKMYTERRKKCLDTIHNLICGQQIPQDHTDSDWYDKWVEQFDGTGYEGWWD